jgi:hypothetical protein
MSKRFGTAAVVVIAAAGIVFLALDILDIAENFRVNIPSSIFDTVFIAAMALFVVVIAARKYVSLGIKPIVWLSFGTLAFGAGNLTRWWLPIDGLSIPITTYDNAILLAAILHFLGAIMCNARQYATPSGSRPGPVAIFFGYPGVLAAVALIVLLAYRGVVPSFYTNPSLRNIVHGISAVLFLTCFLIYLRLFLKLRYDYLYWYSLGLVLFTLGIFFLSQGAINSRLFWLGKAAHYSGHIYLFIAVTGAQSLHKSRT